MNKLHGIITNVQTSGNMSIATVELAPQLHVKAIVLETPETASYLALGHPVDVLFKETEVVLATGPVNHISLQNKLSATVQSVEKGTLLSRVMLTTEVGNLTAVISTNAVEQLQLAQGTAATAMIKLNEVMLAQP